MSLLPLSGRARVLGDDINTDYIISSRRKRETIDPQQLRRYLLEDLDPEFARSVRAGDVIVAGRNFGCGSAMEVAVTVVIGSGIGAVIARSFSRTYLRNALNNGLLAICAETSGIVEGEMIELVLDARANIELRTSTGGVVECEPLPAFMQAMLEAGGLVPYLRAHKSFA
jgi:3-isopropylmalate/(R)-2-methylmalate dehydratase small subunit